MTTSALDALREKRRRAKAAASAQRATTASGTSLASDARRNDHGPRRHQNRPAVGAAPDHLPAAGDREGHAQGEPLQRLRLRGQPDGRQGRRPPGGGGVVRREGGAGEHPEPQGQAAPQPLPPGNHQGLEKGHRDARPGTSGSTSSKDGRDHRSRLCDGHSQIQSDHAGPPRGDRERLRRADARRQAGQGSAAAEAAEGRAEQPGQDHRPASRRRPQAQPTA